jgi:hypothetical protein
MDFIAHLHARSMRLHQHNRRSASAMLQATMDETLQELCQRPADIAITE